MDIDKLTDYIDKFFPDCTLCNDTDYWKNGMLCICNNEFENRFKTDIKVWFEMDMSTYFKQ